MKLYLNRVSRHRSHFASKNNFDNATTSGLAFQMQEMNDLKHIAVTRAGLEPIVANELRALGLEVISEGRRRVMFRADHRGFYLANRALRAAVQVLRPIANFQAIDANQLYQRVRDIKWPDLFSADCTFRIDVKGNIDVETNSHYVALRIKDAVADRFRADTRRRPDVAKDEPDVRIVAFFDSRNSVKLYLDGSGILLFKRGYRPSAGVAPLKEDLAAGMLELIGWDGSQDFVDPMAGSGTLLIEAYLMAANQAPNRDRTMAFEKWHDYDATIDSEVRAKLKASERDVKCRFVGYESDNGTFRLMQRNCDRVMGEGRATLYSQPFQRSTGDYAGWFLATNPPYGVRLDGDMDQLYHEIGQFLRTRCPGSRAAIITGNLKALERLGMKAERRWKLYNGQLETRLALFHVFAQAAQPNAES